MGDDKEEERISEIRNALTCSNCNSKNTYKNKSGIMVCRKCGHREEN